MFYIKTFATEITEFTEEKPILLASVCSVISVANFDLVEDYV